MKIKQLLPVKLPDQPGPGECIDLAHPSRGEACDDLIPDGEMPDTTPALDQRRCTVEMPPVLEYQQNYTSENNEQDALRRTGTERDQIMPVSVRHDATEHCFDHSVHDLQRETTFDPVQDNAGPQTDKN